MRAFEGYNSFSGDLFSRSDAERYGFRLCGIVGFQPERGEGNAVQALQWAMRLDGDAVALGRVAHVNLEAVVDMKLAAVGHHAVAHDFGDDGGCGDRLRALIAFDQRASETGQAGRYVAAIGQSELRPDRRENRRR
jgi:hypothetical protein